MGAVVKKWWGIWVLFLRGCGLVQSWKGAFYVIDRSVKKVFEGEKVVFLGKIFFLFALLWLIFLLEFSCSVKMKAYWKQRDICPFEEKISWITNSWIWNIDQNNSKCDIQTLDFQCYVTFKDIQLNKIVEVTAIFW